jgi:hypothetical protein
MGSIATGSGLYPRWRPNCGHPDQQLRAHEQTLGLGLALKEKAVISFDKGMVGRETTRLPIKSAGIAHNLKPDGELTA